MYRNTLAALHRSRSHLLPYFLSFLPSCLPAVLPSYPPALLLSYLPAFLFYYPPSRLCLPMSQPTFALRPSHPSLDRSAFLLSYTHSLLPCYPPSYLPAFQHIYRPTFSLCHLTTFLPFRPSDLSAIHLPTVLPSSYCSHRLHVRARMDVRLPNANITHLPPRDLPAHSSTTKRAAARLQLVSSGWPSRPQTR